MKKILCLMEKTSNKFLDYLHNADDPQTEIHLFSSVIESCESNLFYLAGEIFSFYSENGVAWLFATDVKEIYELAQKIYYPFLKKIIYIENNIDVSFKEEINFEELIKFESNIFQNGSENRLIKEFIPALKSKDKSEYMLGAVDFSIDELSDTEVKKRFYIHICRMMIYAYENKVNNSNIGILPLGYFRSMLMKLEKDVKNTNEYLEFCLDNFSDNEERAYYIWNQIKRECFTKKIESDGRTYELMAELYKKAFLICRHKVERCYSNISYNERKKDVVVVMSIQFLGKNHAPTKTVMERCKSLIDIGKKVYFINTTEQYRLYGFVPYFNSTKGKVIDSYYELEEIDMKGEKVGFHQINNNSTLVEKFHEVAKIIREIKPEYIMSIGTGSILADLCSYIVPCAEMSLVFSTIPCTQNCIPILGRRMTTKEKEEQNRDIIESRFTFELKSQKHQFTRRQFEIPEDSFVLVIVGIRLDSDITDGLLGILEKLSKNGIYTVFAGVYNNYSKMVKIYPSLGENSKFIGYCEDILALMDICDLYVNPDRVGGGYSVIEAFYKGKPGVYLKKGDVYTAGGEEFAVDSFDKMYDIILEYKNNMEFYKCQSEKAKKRALYMTSSINAMKELDEAILGKI